MTEAWSVAKISTHYYKIGHLLLVKYAIYTVKESAVDQYLLELELQIRHQHPQILLIYYNKCLYHFVLEHPKPEEEAETVPETENGPSEETNHLHLQYPQLVPQHENVVSVTELANPSRATKYPPGKKNGKDDTPVDEHLALASLSFLKAVKKCIVYSLSLSGQIQIFGNYLVSRVPGVPFQKTVVQADPILLANGDLIVSLSQRNSLKLFESQSLQIDRDLAKYSSSFVIYVVPSGLRCHLYDSNNYDQSYTYTAPKSSDNLLRLLKLSTGIDLTKRKKILWVKLIPNLQHLNNQTSKVSRFVHEVDNKKYILWPWELCLLQYGSVEESPEPTPTTGLKDPMSLISEFMQFSINCHENDSTLKHPRDANFATANDPSVVGNHFQAFSVPSVLSTGVSTGGDDTKHDITMDLQELNANAAGIFQQPKDFYDANIQDSVNGEEGKDVNEKPSVEEDHDLDDLFGDSFESDTKDGKSTPEEEEKTETIAEEGSVATKEIEVDEDLFTEKESKSEDEKHDILVELKSEDKKDDENSSFIKIPKDQMITAAWEPLTVSYDDPGAPLPIVPTPIISQAMTNPTFTGYTPSAPSSQPPAQEKGPLSKFQDSLKDFGRKTPKKQGATGENLMGYVFSPISFNPKIKSNIDTKYGKGGKFYVAHESSGGPEESKPRLRETSVYNVPSLDIALLRDSHSIGPEGEQSKDGKKENGDGQFFLGQETGAERMSQTDSNVDQNYKSSDGIDDDAMDVDHDDEIDEDEEDEEESDADEEFDDGELKTSPLKLNTTLGDIFLWPANPGSALEYPRHGPSIGVSQGIQSSGYVSPSGNVKIASAKTVSPFGLGLSDSHYLVLSPLAATDMKSLPLQVEDHTPGEYSIPEGKNPESSNAATPSATPSAASGVTESSNCLPLILRSINVYSIPSKFLTRNSKAGWGAALPSGFNMDVEEDDDFEAKEGGLSVRLSHLDEFLKWFTSNAVYDMGLQNYDRSLYLKTPGAQIPESSDGAHDGEVSPEMARVFTSVFPLSYKIKLSEFIAEWSDERKRATESPNDLEKLHFLNDLSGTELLEPGFPRRKAETIFWDSISPERGSNRTNFDSYRQMIRASEKSVSEKAVDDNYVFGLTDVKAKVYKNEGEIVNLNFVGTKLWRYMNFSPVHGEKRFQVLLIAENRGADHMFDGRNFEFLDMLRDNYKANHFGSVQKLNLPRTDARPDLDGVSNGLMLVDKDPDQLYRDFYRRIDTRLRAMAELIKLDLIGKTNRFEFDRPLLLMFVDSDPSMGSVLQISKICRNLKLFLADHQLALVELFAHIVPASHLVKQAGPHRRLKYLSLTKLTKLSMSLYNKCPDPCEGGVRPPAKEETRRLYTHLLREPPALLQFKLFSRVTKEGSSLTFQEDLFLHIAYERSVDKNWLTAAWSDPLGIVTHTRLWYCPAAKDSHGHGGHSLDHVIGEIWAVSSRLFKKLTDGLQGGLFVGKRFLVLTRINSIIPDDELVFWKQLTTKYKDVSLIVLSTNRLPKQLFQTDVDDLQALDGTGAGGVLDPLSETVPGALPETLSTLIPDFGTSVSPVTSMLATSPAQPLPYHSPQFVGGLAYFSAADDDVDADYVVRDPRLDIVGVIPKTPLPSFNSPTRLGMRIGYLVRETWPGLYLVFEVTLLLCSAYWSLGAIMKILLNQYKKLIVLNDVLGVCTDRESTRTLVPWHINAVVKTLDYLVHVYVDETRP